MAPQRRRERRGKEFLKKKYSDLCELRASAVNLSLLSLLCKWIFICRVVPSGT
jgi:hypothetical protein